jgi:hypothetical protein
MFGDVWEVDGDKRKCCGVRGSVTELCANITRLSALNVRYWTSATTCWA